MSDFLLENQAARKLIQSLGLPVPVPAKLRRAKGPMQERPLADREILVGCAGEPVLVSEIARTLVIAGASPNITDHQIERHFAELSEAYGRPVRRLHPAELPERFKASGIVFDATGMGGLDDLRQLYDFFHPFARRIANNGRVVVLGRPPLASDDPELAAANAALEGFVRSFAKEIGKRGATATLLYVHENAEDRVEGPLRYLLSERSAFISGQPLHVTASAKTDEHAPFTRPLDGKVALVTGAARGIGAATAELLADEGAHVVCLDRPADDALCSKVARSIGGSVLLADVSTPDAPARIADELAERHGGVDIVVHNAGVTRDKTLARMKPEQWDQTVDINLRAVAAITTALLAGPMRDNGRIVLLSSVAGIAGNMGQTNYAASKSGVIGYMRALSTQLATRGITVNAIAPGFIETRLTAAIPVMIREAGRRLSNLGQGGLPRDVGDAITFLSTPGAAGLTGNVLRVCGGALIGA